MAQETPTQSAVPAPPPAVAKGNVIPQQWYDAVSQFADKIAAVVSPLNPLTLDVKNISQLTPAEAASVRLALETELGNRSFHLVRADSAASHAATKVVITLSEDAEGYVWIVEIGSDHDEIVAMVSVKKGSNGGGGSLRSSLILERDLIGYRPEPFLDFNKEQALRQTQLVTLQNGALVKYYGSNKWNQGYGSESPFREIDGYRDFRGRLTVGANRIEVRIGGTLCASPSGPLRLECGVSSDDRWPFPGIGESPYAPGRNYFLGFTTQSTGMKGTGNPFYSAAVLRADHVSFWILTELDGKARLYEQSNLPSAVFSDWGDDISSISSGCDAGWHVLVTGTGDWTQPDKLQAYEVDPTTYQATAVGQPLQLPGPVLALWPSDDGKSARVVSRNLQTGMYEASLVSVSCGN
ncbi:MAG: hypothetical protein WA192_16430 [Candidatus Acidiferrales bacterium]